MAATLLSFVLVPFLALSAAPADSAGRRVPAADSVAADTGRVSPRVVRRFPPIEVRALLHDLRSTETVRVIPTTVLHDYPVASLADVLALQPGVVAEAEELHVRGGRAGETATLLDGLSLDEPLRRRPMPVPLLALRSAELVSGAPEASYGGLAGAFDLRTVDPGPRAAGEWRWTSDGRLGTHYDRVAARGGTPLPVAGLGVVAAGEAMLDDTSLPYRRTTRRDDVAGLSFGWRAENQLTGFLKLAPLERPDRFSAEVLVSREVHEPYSPAWSLDGWTDVPPSQKDSPTFSPVPQPGYFRYRAADHLGITDEGRLAALLRAGTQRGSRRFGASLGWLRTRGVTSMGGGHEPPSVTHRPRYGKATDRDLFYVPWGDDPLYRESGSDVFTLRGDGELVGAATGSIRAGAAVTYEEVSLREMDWMPFAIRAGDPGLAVPLDSIRSYRAFAPGGFAYLQGRWLSGGLLLHLGLRAEYFTAGPQASHQTLPGSARGVWSFGPRLGLAYPISVRDVFSLAYVRVQQAPGRDFLYDRRTAISDRQPLGNPALEPATLISYEAAVKHLFGPAWALQASVFYRDVFGQVGAVDAQVPEGTTNLRYSDADESHVGGIETSVVHATEHGRLEAHYTWMNAWGNESRPEGDPYGPVRAADLPPIEDRPLSWDRRHTLGVNGAWSWADRWALSWSTSVASPLPWTPKPRRVLFTDLGLIDSRRLGWSERTDLDLRWRPLRARSPWLGLEVRNLFDGRAERRVTVDGYPSPVVNTVYDDYSAYRTETGLGGGAYWLQLGDQPGYWVPVHDPRLLDPPRTVRASVGASW